MASGQMVAKDAFISIEDSGATARTVSGDTNTSALSRTAETPETTAYGDSTRTRSGSGLLDWTLTATCFFNDTASTGVETVCADRLGQQTVVAWGPAGSASGYVKYSGSAILQDYSVESPVEGMATLSLTLVASAGSLTRATF